MTDSLRGQIAVVTGADSGIGRSAAEMLLRAGASVTMICGNRRTGELALVEMREAVSALGASPGALPSQSLGARVSLELADLSRQDDVRLVAGRIAARLRAIDILVNNAGIYPARRALSADGFELTFATNYLSHFLLTRLLLERLVAGRGRIVNVSSRVHGRGALRRASLEDIARGRVWTGRLQAYADSKLANLLFTVESVRRWRDQGISANALHPGVLPTGIWRNTPRAARLFVRAFPWIMKSADAGGEAVMNLVGDPSGDGVTGRYFNVRVEEAPSPKALDEPLAHELWQRSLMWTGGRADGI